MLEVGLLLGAIITVGVVIAIAILVSIFKGGRKVKPTAKVVEQTAFEKAAALTVEDIEEMTEEYSGNGVPMVISDNVSLQTSKFKVDWVEAYGVKYDTVLNATQISSRLTDKERYNLRVLYSQLQTLQAELPFQGRHRRSITRHGETVWVYEPCLMKIDAPSREGQKARIAVKIAREGLNVYIEEVYTSDVDVTDVSERYTWKWDNPDRVEAFDLLIREDKATFGDEIALFEQIEQEIEMFNEYVSVKKRIALDAEGNMILLPPTVEELKQRALEAKKKEQEEAIANGEAVAEVVEEVEEVVEVEPVSDEKLAEKEVHEVFVSSANELN